MGGETPARRFIEFTLARSKKYSYSSFALPGFAAREKLGLFEDNLCRKVRFPFRVRKYPQAGNLSGTRPCPSAIQCLTLPSAALLRPLLLNR